MEEEAIEIARIISPRRANRRESTLWACWFGCSGGVHAHRERRSVAEQRGRARGHAAFNV